MVYDKVLKSPGAGAPGSKRRWKRRHATMIIAEISIVPVGTATTGVGKYVQAVVEELNRQEGIRIKPEAMGTVIEAQNLKDLFKAVEKAHNSVFDQGVRRVVTELRIDDRRDKEATIESKTGGLK
jgi:uncharacterized protein (TIGR00106 family)